MSYSIGFVGALTMLPTPHGDEQSSVAGRAALIERAAQRRCAIKTREMPRLDSLPTENLAAFCFSFTFFLLTVVKDSRFYPVKLKTCTFCGDCPRR